MYDIRTSAIVNSGPCIALYDIRLCQLRTTLHNVCHLMRDPTQAGLLVGS
jgi:hypothetical protein